MPDVPPGAVCECDEPATCDRANICFGPPHPYDPIRRSARTLAEQAAAMPGVRLSVSYYRTAIAEALDLPLEAVYWPWEMP